MSGVVAGLIGSVKAAAATPTNLVLNPSFTDDSTAGWSAVGDNYFSRRTTTFRTAPASLSYDNSDGEPTVSYTRESVLTVGQRYSLSLYLLNVNGQSYTIKLYAGTTVTTLTTSSTTPNTWVNFKIENVLCAGNTTLQVEVSCVAFGFIDDISVVQGATALVL